MSGPITLRNMDKNYRDKIQELIDELRKKSSTADRLGAEVLFRKDGCTNTYSYREDGMPIVVLTPGMTIEESSGLLYRAIKDIEPGLFATLH